MFQNINAAHTDIQQNPEIKECQEEEESDGGENRRRRRKCSEVDQPRVKQALGQQVMHATAGVHRDQRRLLM